jgi:branched-chain amino acid transport system permease protein
MFDISNVLLLQSFINALCLGWIYILIAIGLSLIFGIMNILQFAHGEIYMIGAYVVYYFCVVNGLNYFVAMGISVVFVMLLGLFLERFFFRPLAQEPMSTMVAALGLMILLQAVVLVGFGPTQKAIPSFAPQPTEILGITLGTDRLIAVGISIAMLLFLYLFLKRTKEGLALTAAAQHKEASFLMGINPNRMSAIAMAIGCAMAAIAGGLMGVISQVSPFMGGPALLKGLIVIILGGVGSLLGVVVGGLIMGFIDGIFPVVFSPAVATVAPLVIVAIILMLRPQGLFGREQ